MDLKARMDAIAARCSKFSGFNLAWSAKGNTLTLEDPAKPGQSKLTVTPGLGGKHLREVYGRLRHWAVTVQEQDTMLEVIEVAQLTQRELPV